MPVIDFPSNPSNNELFVVQGKAMRYNSAKNKWRHVTTLSSSQVTKLENNTIGVSSMSVSGNTLVIEKDNGAHANVSLASFAGNILTNYASASQLPTTNLVSGQQVYVTDTDSLFITDGSGWYKIATVNLSPSLSLGVSSISLQSGGSIDVNYTVNEPEDTPFTVSASATANASITVHQANNTLTFNNPTAATSETITISATDGVNTVADTLTMSITLGPDWPNATTTAFNHPSLGTEARFGIDIDMDETTLVIGSDAESTYRGAVRVYTRASISSAWVLQQTITGPNNNSSFGSFVSLDGDNLAVAMPGYDSGGTTNTGGAQVWTRTGTTWTQQGGNIVPGNDQHIQHGIGGIKILGDHLLLGSPYDDSTIGSVYYYNRSGNSWSFTSKLNPSGNPNARFGEGLDMSGNVLVVGERNHLAGKAHLFTLSGTTWTHEGTITASDGQNGDQFGAGSSVRINTDGNTIVIGAKSEDGGSGDPKPNAGAVYVFNKEGFNWNDNNIPVNNVKSLPGYTGLNMDQIGAYDFSSDGTVLFAYGRAGGNEDRVYGYTLSTPYTLASLTGASTGFLDVSGQSTDGSGTAAAVTGTSLKIGNSGTRVYVLDPGSDKVFQWNLSTANDLSSASYGTSFSVASQETTPHGIEFKPDGTKMYITGQSTRNIYEYNLSTPWDVSSASFHQSIHVGTDAMQAGSGTNIVSSARGLAFNDDGTRVYVVCNNNNVVFRFGLSSAYDISTATYTKRDGNGILIGYVALPSLSSYDDIVWHPEGSSMYIGASSDDRITEFNTSNWIEQAKLVASDAQSHAQFGGALDVDDDGNQIVIVAKMQAVNGNNNVGQGYIFERSGSTWTQAAILNGSTAASSEMGSRGTAILGRQAMISAPGENISGQSNAGRVYQFDA